MTSEETGDPPKLTLWQRIALRELRRKAGRADGEPLKPEDWGLVMSMHEQAGSRGLQRLLFKLPSSPRCGMCGAPFEGPGRWFAGPFGYRPYRKNPTVCGVCVELSPPGGMKMETGVLFADLRGFTARFDGADSEEASDLLRRFYRCAEDVLFPEAIIDKLIGDEVMALYLPRWKKRTMAGEEVLAMMLEHGRGLLRAVGYGTPAGPFAELGVGIDFGEAFVGNIGQRALYDFTAVGDVVNTASRLQGQAAGGEIILSERVASGLPGVVGEWVELTLKGKAEPQVAIRTGI